jgi:hypothetical protein
MTTPLNQEGKGVEGVEGELGWGGWVSWVRKVPRAGSSLRSTVAGVLREWMWRRPVSGMKESERVSSGRSSVEPSGVRR